jgi:hypothetical protein
MLVVLFFSSLWGISSVIPLATNTHFKFTVVFLFSQITAFILCYFGLVLEPKLYVIPLALLISEFCLFLYSIYENNIFFNLSFREFFRCLKLESLLLLKKFSAKKLIH